MNRQLSWHLVLSLPSPFVGAVGVMLAAGWMGIVAVELLRSPVEMGPEALVLLALGLLPQLLVWLLPMAAAIALLSSLHRWRVEGAWEGLLSAGVGGNALLPVTLMLVSGVGGATACLTHWLAPLGEQVVRTTLEEQARPRAGQLVHLGEWSFVAEQVHEETLEGVLLVNSEASVAAVEGRLPRGAGVLELTDGEMTWWGDVPARMTWKNAKIRVPAVQSGPPRHPSYEQAIGMKKTSWPVAAGLLLLLCVPAALSGAGWLPALGFLLFWVMTRTMDHMAGFSGAVVSAWLPTLVLAVGTMRFWLRWRER